MVIGAPTHTGSKVYLIENGKKRWVQDPETVASLGGWGAVTEVAQESIDTTPDGLDYPSVLFQPTVTVPDVKDLGIRQAAQALGAVGLNWDIKPPSLSTNPHVEVHNQNPGGGAKVKRHSIVTLTVVLIQ